VKRSNRGFSPEIARDKKNSRITLFFLGYIQKLGLLLGWRQELAVGQNSRDLGHGRARKVGEKREEVEGVPFYTLLAAEMHRGGRSLDVKEAVVVCSSQRDNGWWRCLPRLLRLRAGERRRGRKSRADRSRPQQDEVANAKTASKSRLGDTKIGMTKTFELAGMKKISPNRSF
jgi:hypothetical protein